MNLLRRETWYSINDISAFKSKLLAWSQQFEEVVWLDGNGHKEKYSSFDAVLAVDALTSVVTDAQKGFQDLREYQSETKDWIFGYLSYDLKNDIEQLSSQNFDGLEFPDLYFFQPKRIITISGDKATFNYLHRVGDEIETDFTTIMELTKTTVNQESRPDHIRIRMRIFKDVYFKQVEKMLAYIHRGDIYEANFCQEFYVEDTQINALRTYQGLNRISKAPFSAFLKMKDKFVLSASPERYLKKEAGKVLSQPIKGTAPRALNLSEDKALRRSLQKDEKERAENIMIVDLVRNDLSKSALKGSVRVEELCEIYSFEQVHQMISTVSALVSERKNPVDILKETFPMGSMTGAPKVSAMKIIEELESFKRGIYSGAVGYFTPSGGFDFNVVIRSILYNASKRYVSYSVGSAITARSIPEREYEECLLKAKAMREVLESTTNQ